MKYKAVIKTEKNDSTLTYKSKPYKNKLEAINDLNIELTRVLKKGKVITYAHIETVPETKTESEPGYGYYH